MYRQIDRQMPECVTFLKYFPRYRFQCIFLLVTDRYKIDRQMDIKQIDRWTDGQWTDIKFTDRQKVTKKIDILTDTHDRQQTWIDTVRQLQNIYIYIRTDRDEKKEIRKYNMDGKKRFKVDRQI